MKKKYFLNANIYGADIDRDILRNEDRIKTYYVDQTDPKAIDELFKNIGDIKFDIILDDGGHTNLDQIITTVNTVQNINDGGV